MPNPPPYTACYSVHAACVAYKVSQFMLAPLTYNLPYELWLCDQVLQNCLKGHINPPGLLTLLADELTEIAGNAADTLEKLVLWAQMNPGTALFGTVLVVGTVAAIVYLGPGGIAVLALT